MLEACLEIFERQPDIDKLILDTYAPAEGTYAIMAYENGQFVVERIVSWYNKFPLENVSPIICLFRNDSARYKLHTNKAYKAKVIF